MYTLYIANKNYSSWSLRPWILMSELSIPFTEKLFPFKDGIGANYENFKRFSPNAKVPCLHSEQHIIWDSLAIVEYLAEHHQGIWPENIHARIWARSATAEMHSGFSALRQQCPMSCGLRVQLHEISNALKLDIERIDELWNEGLQQFGGPFLTGASFTAVDAFFAPVAFRVQTYHLPLSEASNRYVEHLLSLHYMRQWETAALQEPWREPDHEKEILMTGIVTADYRK